MYITKDFYVLVLIVFGTIKNVEPPVLLWLKGYFEWNLIQNLQCKFMLENINLNTFYYLFTVVIGKARQTNELIYYTVPDPI